MSKKDKEINQLELDTRRWQAYARNWNKKAVEYKKTVNELTERIQFLEGKLEGILEVAPNETYYTYIVQSKTVRPDSYVWTSEDAFTFVYSLPKTTDLTGIGQLSIKVID